MYRFERVKTGLTVFCIWMWQFNKYYKNQDLTLENRTEREDFLIG